MKIKSIETIDETKDIFCVQVDNPEHEIVLKCNSGNTYRVGQCNFGLIYGLSKKSFIEMNAWTGVSAEICSQAYDKFFETYKNIDATLKNARYTFMHGQDRTIWRWLKFSNGSLHRMEKKVPFFTTVRTLLGRVLAVDTERKMVNYPVQGSGADAIKLAICKMGTETRQIKSSYRTINLVHDDTIAESLLKDFDSSSKIFRDALEFAINYILKYMFYTPVEQDFCILSLLGEETFLEGALTLKDIEEKLVARIQHLVELIRKEEDAEEQTKLTIKANQQYKLLEKFRNKIKELNIQKLPE